MAYRLADLPRTAADFRRALADVFEDLAQCPDLDAARRYLYARTADLQHRSVEESSSTPERIVTRDCARACRGLFTARSEALAGFSLVQALWDVACERPRPDLQPAFYADLYHIVLGLAGRAEIPALLTYPPESEALSGRAAALRRSDELDQLWALVEARLSRYPTGLDAEVCQRRSVRRAEVLTALEGQERDWGDWQWQVGHLLTDAGTLSRACTLTPAEVEAVHGATAARLPFGITPYYASLLDSDPEAGRDRAVRRQVLPPASYVNAMGQRRDGDRCALDFMREHDTSPVDLVTRRYPAIVILKPYNTCPQICVYCQRNWEIDAPMAPGALAPWPTIEAACDWIAAHPAIREVLITGGDPLAMADADLERILDRLARIPSVDLIRLGTRVPVTLPMRVTPALAALLGRYRDPGRREVCVVTHVEHVYEITPELVAAVDRLRRQGIGLYNQLVYTYYVSRRFEAAALRLLLRRCGIDPYYTFVPKGKGETADYRVPVARILQERKEEARLLPGTRRTDEPVYNLPGLGKNYLRVVQHHDLISVLPDGSRFYEFHPWEKNVVARGSYAGPDVPILGYLERLAAEGEDPADYASIWYYF